MSIIQRIVDKLPGGDRMQYILVGTLILVIIISLFSIFLAGGKKGESQGHGETPRFWCIETEKEFTLKPEDFGPGGRMMGLSGSRVISPYTDKLTGVPMMKCPNPECKKWFVPLMYLDAADVDGPMPSIGKPGGMVCTYCGTDIQKWYEDRRKKGKK